MPAQPPEEFLNDEFVIETARTLDEVGFVADEHEFAPYRETVCEQVGPIRDALEDAGHEFALAPGFIKHPKAGFAYFIYDTERFADHDEAASAVTTWLDDRYFEQ